MTISVNINECLSEGLSPSQYCYLKLLWEKNNTLARDLWYNDSGLQKTMGQLVKSGYILFFSEETGYSIDRKKCDKLFKFSQSDFWELFNVYPIKVNNGTGGVRVLRAKDYESKDAQTAMAKYNSIITTKAAHKKVMKCLDLELENRKVSNSMAFMQNLITWINQRTWEKYEALLEEEQPKDSKHGERLI